MAYHHMFDLVDTFYRLQRIRLDNDHIAFQMKYRDMSHLIFEIKEAIKECE